METGMLRKGIFHSALFLLVYFLLALGAISPRAEAKLIGQPAPEINNKVWINSAPIRMENLRGKVVLLEFWTYG